MRDKAVSEMLQMISGAFDEIKVTGIQNERACTSGELKQKAEELKIPVLIENDPVEYVKQFTSKPVDNCLVVLGSMYLLGEIKSSFLNKFILTLFSISFKFK